MRTSSAAAQQRLSHPQGDPVASNDTPQGRAQNRRVELPVPASGCRAFRWELDMPAVRADQSQDARTDRMRIQRGRPHRGRRGTDSSQTLHAGRTHRVAFPPGWSDALLSVRRWPHLLQGREAASAEPGWYGQYPAGYNALARRLPRSSILTSGAIGSGRTGPRHRLGRACHRRRIQRAGDRRLKIHPQRVTAMVKGFGCRPCWLFGRALGPASLGASRSLWRTPAIVSFLNP